MTKQDIQERIEEKIEEAYIIIGRIQMLNELRSEQEAKRKELLGD